MSRRFTAPLLCTAFLLASIPARADVPSGKKEDASAELRQAGVFWMGLSGVPLVLGVLGHLSVRELDRKLAAESSDQKRSEQEAQRKSDNRIAWTCTGIGAGLFAIGATLYFIGLAEGPDFRLVLRPALAPGAAGALLQGRF